MVLQETAMSDLESETLLWLALLAGSGEGGRAQNGRTGHLRRWAVNQSMMIRFEICQIITLVGMYAKIKMIEIGRIKSRRICEACYRFAFLIILDLI